MTTPPSPDSPVDFLLSDPVPAAPEDTGQPVTSGQPGPPSETDPPPRPRRRGAPPGNRNALKHGFYSSNFNKAEVKALQSYNFSGLTEEITLLRLFIRRVVALGAQTEDLVLSLELLRALSLSVTSLNRLVRTQALLPNDKDEISLAIQDIYDELIAPAYGERQP